MPGDYRGLVKLGSGIVLAVLAGCTLIAAGCEASGRQPAVALRTIYVPQFAGTISNSSDAVGTLTRRPRFILLGEGADGGQDGYSIIHWFTYGGTSARATATQTINTCTPDCANGRRVTVRVVLRLQGQIPCRGASAYGTMAVTRTTFPALAVGVLPRRWTENLAPLCDTVDRRHAQRGYYPQFGVGTAVPLLRNAAARGVLVGLDPTMMTAEFRITCGWHYSPKRRLHPGLWKISLRGLRVSFETYPNGPASGIAHSETVRAWQGNALRHGWFGALYLSRTEPAMTNGPTTDICAGVLG
jgi:hypothetical protein